MSTNARLIQSPASPSLSRFVIRHPLVTFFVIAFAGSWLVTLPLVLAQNGLGVLPYTISEPGLVPLSYWFAIPASIFGPTLASFTVTAITAGKSGLRQLIRRYVLWQVGIRWVLLVLVGVPLIQLVGSSIILGMAPLTSLVQQWRLFFSSYLPNVLIIIFAVQIWEEGGWSGFAIPNLQQRFGGWRSCLIFGPLWALFHLPFFFVPGQIFPTKVGVSAMVVQMVLLIFVATFTRFGMTWVFNNTKGSVFVAILLHAALDASNSASDFIKQLLTPAQIGVYGLVSALLVPLVATVVLLIFTKGRLSFRTDRPAQTSQAYSPVRVS